MHLHVLSRIIVMLVFYVYQDIFGIRIYRDLNFFSYDAAPPLVLHIFL